MLSAWRSASVALSQQVRRRNQPSDLALSDRVRTTRLVIVTGNGPDVDVEPLMVASRTINAVIVKSLAAVDADLTVPQLRVMVILSRTASASLSEVAEQIGISPSNASRTCDQLVRRGLVVRTEDQDDRRRLSLAPSAAGRRMLRQVMRRRQNLLERIVGAMPEKEQRALMTALDAFNLAAEQTGAAEGADDRGAERHARWVG